MGLDLGKEGRAGERKSSMWPMSKWALMPRRRELGKDLSPDACLVVLHCPAPARAA